VTKIEVRLANETVWLTADQMAELFQRNECACHKRTTAILPQCLSVQGDGSLQYD